MSSLLKALKAKQQSGGESKSVEDLAPGNHRVDGVKFKSFETKDGGNMLFVDLKIDGTNYSSSMLFSGMSKSGKETDVETSVERLASYNLTVESKFLDIFITDLEYLIQEGSNPVAYEGVAQAFNDNINNYPNLVNVSKSKDGRVFTRFGFCTHSEVMAETKFVNTGDVADTKTTEEPTSETKSFEDKLNDKPSFI